MTFAIYDFGQRILTPVNAQGALQKLSEIHPAVASGRVQNKNPYRERDQQSGAFKPKDPYSQSQSKDNEQQAMARFKKHAQVFEALADKAKSDNPIYLRDIMSTEPITIQPRISLGQAHALMIKTGVRHLPVLDAKQHVVGLLSDRDMLKVLLGRGPLGLTVDKVMESKVLVAEPGTDIRQAAQVLKEYHIGCLPILNSEGTLLGIVTRTDLLGVLSAYGPLHIKA